MSQASEKWSPPSRRRIYLMRHGEVDYFDPQGKPQHPACVPLTPLGRQQAEAARDALASVPLDRVITSGLPRTVETASFIVHTSGLTLEVEANLREIEPGRLKELADPEQAFRDLLEGNFAPERSFLGGETFGSFRERVVPCFWRLVGEPAWSHLLIVAHGIVNRLLLGECLGVGLEAVAHLEQDAGGINLIEVDEAGKCTVRLVNHTPLDPLKQSLTRTTTEILYVQFLRGRPPKPAG
jgi:broad specificity phosphatase PhoE